MFANKKVAGSENESKGEAEKNDFAARFGKKAGRKHGRKGKRSSRR